MADRVSQQANRAVKKIVEFLVTQLPSLLTDSGNASSSSLRLFREDPDIRFWLLSCDHETSRIVMWLLFGLWQMSTQGFECLVVESGGSVVSACPDAKRWETMRVLWFQYTYPVLLAARRVLYVKLQGGKDSQSVGALPFVTGEEDQVEQIGQNLVLLADRWIGSRAKG
jgi:hypothetical protein